MMTIKVFLLENSLVIAVFMVKAWGTSYFVFCF